MLWYTNPHISVDRLIFVLSGDRGLLTVCRLAHPEATEVSSESPTCFLRRGFNTNCGSSVPIQHPASLAQLVEQWTLNPWVTGSSPVGASNFNSKSLDNQGFFACLKSICPIVCPTFFMSNLSRYL